MDKVKTFFQILLTGVLILQVIFILGFLGRFYWELIFKIITLDF